MRKNNASSKKNEKNNHLVKSLLSSEHPKKIFYAKIVKK
nr:hypothetical protein B11C_110002 [Bartonella sp. 1-1C]